MTRMPIVIIRYFPPSWAPPGPPPLLPIKSPGLTTFNNVLLPVALVIPIDDSPLPTLASIIPN